MPTHHPPRSGVPCGRPMGRGAAPPPLALPHSTTPRLTGPRSGTHGRARAGSRRHPTSSSPTPIGDPGARLGHTQTRETNKHPRTATPHVGASLVGARWGGTRHHHHSPCRTPPPLVLPDPNPVPTVGRGTGAAPANHHPLVFPDSDRGPRGKARLHPNPRNQQTPSHHSPP